MKKNLLDVTALIRSIQRAEGNPDCFRRAEDYCDQLGCAWRAYCLEKPNDPPYERERDLYIMVAGGKNQQLKRRTGGKSWTK